MVQRPDRFELFYRAGWAYLTVHDVNAEPVYPEEIESRMKMLGIPRVSYSRLQDIIHEASGLPVALVEWPEGKRLAAEISVEIPEDEMSAWVTVKPPRKGADAPSVEDIHTALREHGVTAGIDFDAIKRLLGRQEYGRTVSVAQGKLPVHAEGRRVEYHFMLDRGKPYLKLDFDRIDLKELNFIDNKEEGELLARLLPPRSGADGWTVSGRRLAAESAAADQEIAAGQNTVLNVDKTELYAGCRGNARVTAGRIIVEPVVQVENVDYETGNIHFDGSVVVDGFIADGFTVEASGDIQVAKSVGKASLTAGGNVLLQGGINGNVHGTVRCGGNFFAKYVESCSVECDGNALIEEAVLRSSLTVWGHCVLNGRRAECIASELLVGGSFWCKKLGNHLEAPTHVALGVPPDLILELRSVKAELEGKVDLLNSTEQKLDRIETAIGDGKQDSRLDQAYNQLQSELEELQRDLASLRRRLPELREKLHAARHTTVVVEETIYKGAVVTFGSQEYRAPENGSRRTVLHPGLHQVQESGYDPRNRPTLSFDESGR